MPDDVPPAARILPTLTEHSRQFWTGGAHGQLEIARCAACDMWVHPPAAAIVELAEQTDLRIATNIVGCEPDAVYVGMPVEVRFERHDADGESVYAPVFVPSAS